MATTWIRPIHTGKGRSVVSALRASVKYIENPDKTDQGELISSYECDIRTVDHEFNLSKQRYTALTGRSQSRKDIIAYHARQSFKPGEIMPQEANHIGYELAMRFTKGRYAFIVCTHIDKSHVHSHIVWNSTALDYKRKFRNFIGSAFALRRCSDLLCAENGLSVIENPKLSPGRDYARYMFGDKRPPSFHARLRWAIDGALDQRPASFDEFLDLMRVSGCTVMDDGKHLKFLAPPAEGLPDQVRPTRCDTLKGDYTTIAIRERIAGRHVSAPAGRASSTQPVRSPSLLIDIQSKLQEGKGPGYERFAKLHNLKQMAQTLIYLQERGLDDYAVLEEKTAAASARFNELSHRIKELEERLSANATLQKHIVNYSKTRQTYINYRKAGYSKKFRALHEADIILHQASKKAFDDLGVTKIPTVASLRAEYSPMLDEKKKAYREYRQAKAEMRELITAKSNVDRLLHIAERGSERNSGRLER
ncbi:MAG: relaxase/mobilization nuclease domain-containing protein [Oscillospiraceae bacterium]|nr:relaxase/mobilization nuclease domain-containing protein [Oscillospiraceae bacterium]